MNIRIQWINLDHFVPIPVFEKKNWYSKLHGTEQFFLHLFFLLVQLILINRFKFVIILVLFKIFMPRIEKFWQIIVVNILKIQIQTCAESKKWSVLRIKSHLRLKKMIKGCYAVTLWLSFKRQNRRRGVSNRTIERVNWTKSIKSYQRKEYRYGKWR